jgi:integrase
MANSTTSRTSTKAAKTKPAKPYPDFPLYAHASRRWAKKIKGKTHYFGPWGDPSGALEKYREQADDLHAGRTPTVASDAITVVDLCNEFLRHKKDLQQNGELSSTTIIDYQSSARDLRDYFGRTRTVESLKPADFSGLRNSLAKGVKASTLRVRIQRIRTIFKYADDTDLIDRPIKFGPVFQRPSAKVVRIEKNERGPVMFSREELCKLLKTLPVQFKAMTLLGINCAYQNGDCGRLPVSAIDFDRGWIHYARPKTGVERRCKLWPETIVAIQDWLAVRPEPRDASCSGLVFIRDAQGSWFTGTHTCPLGRAFATASKAAGVYKNGRSFSALRKTFRTVASEHLDEPAADLIMGHSRGDMASIYRQTISDERLTAVSEYVRKWLWPDEVE